MVKYIGSQEFFEVVVIIQVKCECVGSWGDGDGGGGGEKWLDQRYIQEVEWIGFVDGLDGGLKRREKKMSFRFWFKFLKRRWWYRLMKLVEREVGSKD